MPACLRGWLLDLYDDAADSLHLWFISEDGHRVCLRQRMSVTFYAAGETAQLRDLWKMLRKYPQVISLQREQRRDAFIPEPITVLKAEVDNPLRQMQLFRKVQQKFPNLIYYDSDIPSGIRHAALYQTFPMAFCEVAYDDVGFIQNLQVLNSRWDLDPVFPEFSSLAMEPDCDPTSGTPQSIIVRWQDQTLNMELDRAGVLLEKLNTVLDQVDPDFILTNWGDNWLIPTMMKQSKLTGIRLNLNRDVNREVHWQKEITYQSYGQIILRAQEAHLFGRCHIDEHNAMMWRDYGLNGVLESARVTTLPIERAARVSPGSGISAMQMLTALEQNILVPWHKQQVEAFKDGVDLIQRDRGGLVYQPIVGLHANVAQIDFISMYPAIIIKGNISPEVPLPDGIIPASDELGVVPLTLKPLYEKRVALKIRLGQYEKGSPLAELDKARSSALKWLLVVCFGFLGYKNARFGRIEAHEAVTNGGREILLRAKEVAESFGFEVLHLYVDALWLKKKDAASKADFQEVISEISLQTGLGVSLDGIYRWITYLPSRMDARIPVANRYFGVMEDGSTVVRGIEARRRDTPAWVVETQTRMIESLSLAKTVSELPEYVLQAFQVFQAALQEIRSGQVPLQKLVVMSRISHDLEAYRSPAPAARAARIMLAETGRRTKPGQKMRFIYMRGEPDVCPWETPGQIVVEKVDHEKYVELLASAAASVLTTFGIAEGKLKHWAHTRSIEQELSIDAVGKLILA